MNIVILDAATLGRDVNLSILNQYGKLHIYDTTDPDEKILRMKDQAVVITNKVVLDRETLQKCPDLKLICIAATGTNNVDLEAAREMGIAVTNVAGYSTESVVQHTFAMLFYLMEHLPYYDEYVKSGEYVHSPIFTNLDKPFHEVSGKRWGIIGLGTIGRRVAQIAHAFGAHVIYASTSGVKREEPYERVEMEELLKTSDIVSIHAPLNEKTQNMIGENELKTMKPHSILLNLGRGGIVNEEALARALNRGEIGAAGLDVLIKEPIAPDSPFFKVKDQEKLFITPHIAWASMESRQRLIGEVAKNIQAFLEGNNRNRVV
jgi:glycerate dehydrogenase